MNPEHRLSCLNDFCVFVAAQMLRMWKGKTVMELRTVCFTCIVMTNYRKQGVYNECVSPQCVLYVGVRNL